MTDEQKEKRKISAESGHIKWIKDHCLRTKDGEDDYVFISYKSDDYETVLDDIVYNVCRKYGLRVYFDTAFDDGSDSWIKQYYNNMCDTKCKAFVAFLDDAYYSSYACLLEMMSRKTLAAGGDYKEDSLFFLPVNIGVIHDKVDPKNTGLGTRRSQKGEINHNAAIELEKFNEIFSEVADSYAKKIYKREKDNKVYEEKTNESPKSGEMYLCVTQCRKLMEWVIPKDHQNNGENKSFVEVIHDKLVNAGMKSVFGNVEPEQKDTINVKKGEKIKHDLAGINESPKTEGYTYTIFGKEYKAGKQGQLMYDAVVALTERHPDKAEELTKITSISRAEAVTDANTQSAKPIYFRTCQKYKVGEVEYYVGMSYGFGAKIAEIKGMFQICGEDVSQFVLNGAPLESKKKTMQAGSGDGKNEKDCFVFTLWGEAHSAQKLADMMHDVFDIIAEKYPEKIDDIAHNDSITAVALKSDVDGNQLPAAKMNYFSAKKEHKVNGTIYYVSTRYNREQGIAQLKKMIALCEGTSEAFLINSAPDKSTHSSNEKKGLGELLN